MVHINTSQDAIVDSTVNDPSTRRREDTICGFKVGLASEILNTRHSPTALVRANYLTAVASRVDSFWADDHLNALMPRAITTPQDFGAAKLIPKIDASLEPWTMLGHLAARNRLARLRLGVGVTDASRRNPAVTAQAAATLHLLTRGRAILGIGTGEREGNQPYGVDWTKPVARFEEAIATIRTLWDSGGQLVSRDSPHFPLHNAVFDLPPYRGKWPEIWIAAHGPRMLRATGRYADAWLPGIPQRPHEYEQRLEAVRTAASDAGRDPMSITPAAWMFVLTGRTHDDVEEALNSDIAKSFALNISAGEETRGTRVRVVTLCPGATQTRFFEVAGAELMTRGRQTPEHVAAVGLRAFDSGRGPSAVSGVANRMLATGPRIMPRAAMVRLARVVVRPAHTSPP
jgi:phthiodiolone/phenolphthiodiolone dimycocerosates ketoreductase